MDEFRKTGNSFMTFRSRQSGENGENSKFYTCIYYFSLGSFLLIHLQYWREISIFWTHQVEANSSDCLKFIRVWVKHYTVYGLFRISIMVFVYACMYGCVCGGGGGGGCMQVSYNLVMKNFQANICKILPESCNCVKCCAGNVVEKEMESLKSNSIPKLEHLIEY